MSNMNLARSHREHRVTQSFFVNLRVLRAFVMKKSN